MNRKASRFLAYPYMIWMAGFTVIPLLMVFYYGLTDRSGAFTLANILAIGSSEHLKALWLSLALAGVSTVICLLLAYPLALILRKRHIGKGSFVVFIFILPMWMNFLLRTMAWQTLLEKNGVINTFLTMLHLPNIAIINTPAAIILGMVYNFLPFMVLPIYNTLAKIDDNVINAARDLGADNYQTLTKILLPLSVPGIVSGITMVFVPALTTFVISNLLGGSKILLIGNVIEQEFTKGSNWNLGAGLSIVLMVFILLSMTMIAKYDKDGEAFDKAIAANPDAKPIFHSDRGFQYTSKTFKKKLENQEMEQSMSRVGHCIDNGPIEGFWGIIKSEMYQMYEIIDEVSLRYAIKDYLRFYSEERPQDRYGCKTPSEVRQEALSSDVPTEYPIPENKRISKYKEKWCA